MRFVDVSHRAMSSITPSGRTLRQEVPSMGNMRVWNCRAGGYTWVITHEPGLPHWSEQERSEHCGYTASYRKVGQNSSNQTIKVEGGPWKDFRSAEGACRKRCKALRNPS